jgi:hypothetical protein
VSLFTFGFAYGGANPRRRAFQRPSLRCGDSDGRRGQIGERVLGTQILEVVGEVRPAAGGP